MEFEIDLDRAVGAELDLPLGRGIADGRSDEGEATRVKRPVGRFFRKKCPVASVAAPIVVPFSASVT